MSINQNVTRPNSDYDDAASIKKMSIISLVLFFFIITILISLILEIIVAVKILSKNWTSSYARNNNVLFGVLIITLSVIIGSILGIVFANNVLNEREVPKSSAQEANVY